MNYKLIMFVGLITFFAAAIHAYLVSVTYVHILLFMIGSFLITTGFILHTETKKRELLKLESEKKVREFIMKKKEAEEIRSQRQRFKRKISFYLLVIIILIILFYYFRGYILGWLKSLF